MSYLLDTCVISELVKKRPDIHVVAWLNDHQSHAFYLSVLTLGEIEKGIRRLPDSKKRRNLEHWVETEIRAQFTGYLLPISEAVAMRWGKIQADTEQRGITLPTIDGLLAATALEHDLILVTRNTPHMDASGARLINPFSVG